jgi:hypothetical protein
MRNCYLNILSIHILKLEISGCDRLVPGAYGTKEIRLSLIGKLHVLLHGRLLLKLRS